MSLTSFGYLRFLILIAALLLCVGSVISAPSLRDSKGNKGVIIVNDRESIQHVIRMARVGARIEVYGTHYEQVEINKDGITLIGKGAKLFPPSEYDKANYCFGKSQDNEGRNTSAGICIHGERILLARKYDPFIGHVKVEQVGKPVRNVQVSGFEITGFNGQNIAIYGAKDTKISYNKLNKGGKYGLLTVGSIGTEASNNIVIGSSPATLDAGPNRSGPIAMCMDDKSSALFSNNNITDYFIGLCTETDGGINKDNMVRNCCLGNIIDPGVKNAKSIGNDISQWNQQCNVSFAAGISLLGSVNGLVEGNHIDGIGSPGKLGAGLYVGDDLGKVNQDNTIKRNVFGSNGVDIFDGSKGKNKIQNNVCDETYKGLLADSTSIRPAPEFCV